MALVISSLYIIVIAQETCNFFEFCDNAFCTRTRINYLYCHIRRDRERSESRQQIKWVWFLLVLVEQLWFWPRILNRPAPTLNSRLVLTVRNPFSRIILRNTTNVCVCVWPLITPRWRTKTFEATFLRATLSQDEKWGPGKAHTFIVHTASRATQRSSVRLWMYVRVCVCVHVR